jgi:hypothetical protein
MKLQKRSVCLDLSLLTLGDERFMSAEDMDSRFALVVALCLSTLSALISILEPLDLTDK